MAGYLSLVSAQTGVAPWLILVMVIWTLFWKLFAMWKAGRNNHLPWFIVLALVNTAGILPILYIFFFSKMKVRIVEKPLKEKPSKEKKKSIKKKFLKKKS